MLVSNVEASKFHPGRAYVTFDGHRSDDFGTYIFITDDYGSNWNRINSGFTEGEVVRTLKEDHINENLLFVGTETGVYYSLDKGNSWTKLKGLPTVSVYDLKIHPRDNDLIFGSHGRGIWIVDDISSLQQMSEITLKKGMHFFDQKPTTLWHNVSRGGQRGHFWWAGGNPANIKNTSSVPRGEFRTEVPMTFFIGSDKIDSVKLVISHPNKNLSYTKKIKVNQGVNRYFWNREFDSEAFDKQENDWIVNFF